MRVKVFLVLLCCLTLIACERGEKDRENITKSSIKETPYLIQGTSSTSSSSQRKSIPISSTSSNSSILNDIGIKLDSGKIIINPKQAETFLDSLGKKIQKEFSKEVSYVGQQNSQGLKKPAVIISSDKMVIDLNRTQRVMDKWIGILKAVTTELNRSFAP